MTGGQIQHSREIQDSQDPHQQLVVIGAGIAGLAAAWELARVGYRPLLLEAGDAVGGVLSAHRVGGLVLDAGAESFATTRPSVAELIDDLGLTPAVVTPNPVGAWVRHRAGSAPLPSGGLLGIPASPWAADVRRVIGPAGSARACLDLALPRTSARRLRGSLGALVRARMGHRVLDRLVEPVAGGVYAADPDELEIRTVAPGLTEAMAARRSLSAAVRELRGDSPRPGSAVASLAGGMHTLAAALRSAITDAGGTVRVTSGVARIETADQPSSGWTVFVADGSTIHAPRLVIATPGPTTAALIASALPVLPEFGALQSPATEVLLCTLVVDDARLDRAPRGTGVLVSGAANGVRAKALTHATAKWAWLADAAGPGRHVLRLSYGRGDGPDLPAENDLPGIALTDAATLLGVDLQASSVVDTAVVRWSSALPVPAPGHADRVSALRASLGPLGVEIVGSAVAGTGLAAVVADARRAADRLRSTLEQPERTDGAGTAAVGAAVVPGPGIAGRLARHRAGERLREDGAMTVPSADAAGPQTGPARTRPTAREINAQIRYTAFAVYSRGADLDAPQDKATAELVDLVAALAEQDVTIRGFYDVSAMRADADLMVWWHSPTADALQSATRALRRTSVGRSLVPSWSAMGLHRPAEFNKGHIPAFLAGAPAKKWATVYPFVRSYEWYLLPDEERRGMLVEHGVMGREYDQVLSNTVAAFALGDYEWLLALEADELHDTVDLMRHLRASGARRHVREEIPFFSGRRVDEAGVVEVVL